MAATPLDSSATVNPFPFDIYNDGQPPRSAPVLPGGPCNYTDQTLPRCGCRRFWSKQSASGQLVRPQDNLIEICMCSHHACFHEDAQPGSASAHHAPAVHIAGQENERPKTNREPLSPVQDLSSFRIPSSLGVPRDWNILNFQASMPNHQLGLEAVGPARVDETNNAGQDSSMPDTLNWGDFPLPQNNHEGALPPIPSQCLMPSQPPSTASSSQTRYLRPFAGKGLHTLTAASEANALQLLLAHDVEDGNKGMSLPATNGRLTMDLVPNESGHVTPRGIPSQEIGSRVPSPKPALVVSREAFEELSSTVQSHEQRLDKLENPSFSVAGHEECQDKYDHTDLRVTELESRIEQVENILNNDNSSVGSIRRQSRHEIADDATASIVSGLTDATARVSSHSEVYSQLQALQAQVNKLQAAALPTYNSPWELEVVFLPFPLRGIWMEAHDFLSQQALDPQGANADEWTQMPNTITRATPDPRSPVLGEWVEQSRTQHWLLPRAFAAGRAIDQRLKSRGLIKTIAVRGSDACSVQLAINNAFNDILRVSANRASKVVRSPDSPLSEFLGLRQAWVPLRKIHKDSRLRFLAPPEMITPSLWDYAFLASSVVMKATGTHRLYVTQPEAYLQDHELGHYALESGWSWQKLRELSRVYPDSQCSSGGEVPEADALEECWSWNDRLDEVPIQPVASSIRQKQQPRMSRRSSTSPSQQFFTITSGSLTTSRGERAQSPLINRDRKGSRPPYVRTTSLPPLGPVLSAPVQSRRRTTPHAAIITSERRSSPLVPRPSPRLQGVGLPTPSVGASVSKRRLSARSPSVIPRNTPRWSRTSMSRSPSVAPLGPHAAGFNAAGADDVRSERRISPFAYATPYSNAPIEHSSLHYQYHHPNQNQLVRMRAGSRAPVSAGPTNGYDPDDEDEDMADDDRGSSTDPYDSEEPSGGLGGFHLHNKHLGLLGDGADDDGYDDDVDVYQDEGADTEDGRSSSRRGHHHHGQAQMGGSHEYDRQGGDAQPRPEDIPWMGIEDHMSDGENVDPSQSASTSASASAPASQLIQSQSQSQSQSQAQSQEIVIHEDEDVDVELVNGVDMAVDVDAHSDVSSVPSEYPSTHRAWHITATEVANSGIASGMGTTIQATATVGEGQRGPEIIRTGGGADGRMGVGFRIHEDGEESAPASRGVFAADSHWG